MIFSTKRIKLQRNQGLYVVPLGDIQSREEYPRLEALVKWLGKRKAEGHKVAILGMGDYFEAPSPSDRAAIRAAKNGFGMYEDLAQQIVQGYMRKTEELAGILAPVSGDVLGLLRGHHYCELVIPGIEAPAIDTDRYLTQLLDCGFYGDDVVLRLKINGLWFNILATHGYGSARTPGARITKRLRMREVVLNCHWYIMGHDNEKSVYVAQPLNAGGEYFKQYFSGSGSFQKSYHFGKVDGSYAEKLMLPPSALGVVIGHISVADGRLDYHIST